MRSDRYDALKAEPLDALIIGGGVSGAPVFAELAGAGYRVGLVDRGDFASGTSQASGMLIWGGLLYLKHGDLRTVRKLCVARNGLLSRPDIRSLQFRFRTAYAGAMPGWMMEAGLWLYWWLGQRALRPPERLFRGSEADAVAYEEAMLTESDARMVLQFLIARSGPHAVAQNHSELVAARYCADERLWRVSLRDRLDGSEHEVRARLLINAAGVWTDRLNSLCGISSPYRHLPSKGVYLNLQRWDDREHAEIHPMMGQSDVLTSVPWGPVVMWGPTETPVDDLESAFHPDRDDLTFLIENARTMRSKPVTRDDIVSIRCGVRPLAIRHGTKVKGHSLAVSRRHYLACDQDAPAIAIYGGKLTASGDLGRELLDLVRERLPARYGAAPVRAEVCETIRHPALDLPVVSPQWARDREQCASLDDYLRRRTPIAQWIPRMGLGRSGEHRSLLESWARVFARSEAEAQAMLGAYEETVCRTHDSLLSSLP